MPDLGDETHAVLEGAERIWAIGAIHGEAERLRRLHDKLAKALAPGDRLIYLGNAVGVGPDPAGVIDELLRFRRVALMLPGAEPWDVVFLRGGQEEMWQKLLQLQFSLDARVVLEWMLAQGVEPTLLGYGGSAAVARRMIGLGAVALTRWTSGLREAMHARPGHEMFMAALRRFAVNDDRRLLFVNAGIDPARPLGEQRDTFWWGGAAFDAMADPYGSFARVIRGFNPSRRGLQTGPHALTIDGGSGFDGNLVAECLDPSGRALARITA